MDVAPLTRPPVLCYHRIGGPLELGVTRVGRSTFARQMAALARAGWKTLTLQQYRENVLRADVPTCTEFLLTFDDGYEYLAEHAYPILANLGFTATTFVITDHIGKTNTWDVRYTWSRLRHLNWTSIEHWRARGFDFASHGATHRRLTWLDDAGVGAELTRSRELLTARLGTDAARAVAYPFGAVDERIARHAMNAGYELGFGGVKGNGTALQLSRVPVYSWDLGNVPFGLRDDALGTLGRIGAHAANRCAVGTSIMRGLGPRAWGLGATPGPRPKAPSPRQRTAPQPESTADA